MKLLSCILFASLALGANLVHADASCNAGTGLGREANEHLKMIKRGGGQPAERSEPVNSPTTSR